MKLAFEFLSPGMQNGRLSILIFHRVLPTEDPLFPEEMHAARFDVVCDWLKSWFRVLPLDEAVRRLRDGSLPSRAAAITFDDGYADNHDIALPILRKHDLSATFFIATGFIDGGCMWNDIVIEAVKHCRDTQLRLEIALPGVHAIERPSARRALIDRLLPAIKHLTPEQRLAAAEQIAIACGAVRPPTPMMTSHQVRTLRRQGMQIGAHTVNHPILAVLDDDAAKAEIGQGKAYLENLLNEQVTLFAYPNGRPGFDYSSRSVELVRECGFEAAVSTAPGAARPATDWLQLPRFTPWDRSRMKFSLRLASNILKS